MCVGVGLKTGVACVERTRKGVGLCFFFKNGHLDVVKVNDLVIEGGAMIFFDDGEDGAEDESPGTPTGFVFFSWFASRSF